MDMRNFFATTISAAPAPAVATDDFVLDMASGDLVSTILGDTYIASGTLVYSQAGGDNDGVLGSSDGYFHKGVPQTLLDPGMQNFVLVGQIQSQNFGTAFQFIFDNGQNAVNSGLVSGYGIYIDGNNLYFTLCDGALFHYTAWAHGGNVYKDGLTHKIRIIVDRSLASAIIEIDGVAQTVGNNGVALSSIGSVAAHTGTTFFDSAQSPELNNQTFRGIIYRITVSLGNITYDWS